MKHGSGGVIAAWIACNQHDLAAQDAIESLGDELCFGTQCNPLIHRHFVPLAPLLCRESSASREHDHVAHGSRAW